ncbi:hypothetical protein CLV58_101105 [Spirosoma oryzae]|uniref:Uncharacterized protein n=1 Tax=Spirosoma oryzae TaxID=1469603 RepID=A0A2T0TN41_9BACT|nr:hypothetical protein CLV58_101105 [Spirosoma oryzae]
MLAISGVLWYQWYRFWSTRRATVARPDLNG